MNKKIPKHEAVKNQIEKAIRQFKLPGKLPGERTLAKEYGISYMTMRKVIDNLVDEGLVYKIANSGVYVNTLQADHRSSRRVANNKFVPAAKLIAAITKSASKVQHQSNEQAVDENLARQDFQILAQLRKLDGEKEELKRANEILKRVATYFARIQQDRV